VGKFQCCPNAPSNNSVFTGQPECGSSSNPSIPGCENGTFYFKLNLTSSQVYPNLPRVGANDSSGDVLNSNVLAYANQYVYINYPLFDYFNATYTVVQTVVNYLNNKGCNYYSSSPAVNCSGNPSNISAATDINKSLNYGFSLNFTLNTNNFQCPTAGDCVGNFSKFFVNTTPPFFNATSQTMAVQTNDNTPLYVVDIGSSNQFCMEINWNYAFSYVKS
jgi:hypothetical protein